MMGERDDNYCIAVIEISWEGFGRSGIIGFECDLIEDHEGKHFRSGEGDDGQQFVIRWSDTLPEEDVEEEENG